jgi:recombining binding protein suppressor of hairless
LSKRANDGNIIIDQVRYNFYVPPVLYDQQNAPQTGSFPTPSKPVTPFPAVVKYLPPDRAAEAPKGHNARHHMLGAGGPNSATSPTSPASAGILGSAGGLGGQQQPPPGAKLLTLYGENFNKNEPCAVFFGSEPSPYVETRCAEVMGCLPPESQAGQQQMGGVGSKRRPVILVRYDGVVFPSSVIYP